MKTVKKHNGKPDRIRKACLATADLFSYKFIVGSGIPWNELLNPKHRIWMGAGSSSGKNRFSQAFENAFRKPLMEEIKLSKATRVAFQIVCKSITLREFNDINGFIQTKVPKFAKIDPSVSQNSSMKKDEVRLSIWAYTP